VFRFFSFFFFLNFGAKSSPGILNYGASSDCNLFSFIRHKLKLNCIFHVFQAGKFCVLLFFPKYIPLYD